jgi:hypothetical protein
MADDTRRDYWILPPAYRPIVFALSTAVVAHVVWDKTRAPEEMPAHASGWEGSAVAIKSAADAPPSIDVSARLSAPDSGDATPSGAPSTHGKQLNAPGKPVEIGEEMTSTGGSPEFPRDEEERSAINERLYRGFEAEKKRLGIARIIEPGGETDAPGAAPDGSPVAVKALALKTPESLQAAWAAAGLPGEPPAVDFTAHMAIFLVGPSGSGIARVRERKTALVVTYGDSGFRAAGRLKTAPRSEKPLILKRVE